MNTYKNLPLHFFRIFSITILILLSHNLRGSFPNYSDFLSTSYFPVHDGTGHNSIHALNTNYHLYNICKNDIEGYNKTLSGGEYNYWSLRVDIRDAMISRASTGKVGLGLAIAKKIVEQHDGSITVNLLSGKMTLPGNTKFTVSLPIQKVEP